MSAVGPDVFFFILAAAAVPFIAGRISTPAPGDLPLGGNDTGIVPHGEE